MADKTGLVFEIDPRSAEQGEKRIVKSLNSIKAAAEKVARVSGKSIESLAYSLDTLSLVKGPSSAAIKNINSMKQALTGFRAPSAATVTNTVNLLKKLSGVTGPSAASAKNIGTLSAALQNFKAPTATQVKNMETMFKALGAVKVNTAGINDLAGAVSRLTTRVSTLNRELSALAGNLKLSVPRLNQATSSVNRISNTANSGGARIKNLGTDFRVLSSHSLSLSAALLRTRVAFESLFAIMGLKQIYDINVSFQKMEAGIRAVSGSSEAAGDQLNYIREVSNRLGLDVTQVGEGFTRFLGSLQGTAMTGVEAQKVFYGLSQAARVLHLDAQDQEGIFKALGQIMSKGSLQAEELRGQLGDRMPAAFALMAMAMGKTTAELGIMMKKGQVTGKVLRESLINFSVEYQKMAAGGLDQSINGLQASIGRLGNAFKFLVKDLGDSGFNDAIKMIADEITTWMNSLRESGAIKKFGEDLKTAASYLVSLPFATITKDILMLVAATKLASAAMIVAQLPGYIASLLSLSAAYKTVYKSAMTLAIVARGLGAVAALQVGFSALAATTLSAGAAFGVFGIAIAGLGAALYKVYSVWQEYRSSLDDGSKQEAALAQITADLTSKRADAKRVLDLLGTSQEDMNMFTVEDISLKRRQAEAEYIRLKSIRDLLKSSRDAIFLQYEQGKATKEQISWMMSSASTLQTLNEQVDIAAGTVNDLTKASQAAMSSQPYIDILNEAREFGTILTVTAMDGAKAAEEYVRLRKAILDAALTGRDLSASDKAKIDALLKANDGVRKARETTPTGTTGINKLESSLKSLNEEVNKITLGDSFGNVDRLIQLNEKFDEYKKNIGQARVPAEQLAKVEEARAKILEDLNRSLTEYVKDQKFSNAQMKIEIQSVIDETNGIEGSKKAQNDLTAEIDLCNLARQEEIDLRKMNMSLTIAEKTGNAEQVRRIQETIDSIKTQYSERRKNIETLRDEKNALDQVAQEMKGPVAQGFQSVAEAMKSGMTDAVEAMIRGTKNGFSDLWKSIKESFVKGLASMIATAYANPIIISVLQTAGSSIGMSNGTINTVLNGTFGQGSSKLGTSSVGGSISSISSILSSGGLSAGTVGMLNGIGSNIFGMSAGSSFVGPMLPGTSVGAGLGDMLSGSPWGALGGLGANLLGLGGGIGGTIGNIAGSLGGAAIGSSMGTILGMAGGPVGAIIGGFLGTAIGGLFGKKKPTNAAAFGNLNFDTGAATYSHMNKGNSAENMNTLKTAFDQVMTFSQAFNTLGVGKITGGITGIDIGTRDAGRAYVNGKMVTAAAGQFGQLAINALKESLNQANITNSDVKTAIGKTDFTDLSKAMADIDFAAKFQDNLKAYRSEYTAEIELKKQATEAAASLVEQLSTFRDTAARLGLSVTDANSATKAYVDNLVSGAEQNTYTDVEIAVKNLKAQWEAMVPVLQLVGYTATQASQKAQEGLTNNLSKMAASFNGDIQNQILAITDPTQYAINQLDAEFDTIRRNAIALGADMASIEQLYGLKRQKILEESLNNAGSTLRNWLDEQLLGTTSTLSPTQKLTEAQNQFGTQLSLARLGDTNALSNITGNADNLLKIAQDYYASSPEYANLVTFVRSSLENLGAQLDLPGFPSSSDTIAQLIALRDESNTNSQEMKDELSSILAAIEELNRRLLSMSITSGGRAA